MAGLHAQSSHAPAHDATVHANRQSGEHLLDITTEILDYARLEAGRIALEEAPFDPEATMQAVAELLSPKAHAKGLEIAVTVHAGAPARVLGDDGRLRQILFNLAGNAVKFTERGGVLLELSQPAPGLARFSVSDTGPGIAPEMQSRIFEEFAQAGASIARQHGGTGLGLAIVKRLAAAMGGAAALSSRPGEGARFWVDLPLQSLPAVAPQPSLAGLRIAVATPSRLVAQSLAANVKAMGARVATAKESADVALLDAVETPSAEEIEAWRARARALVALAPQEDRGAIERGRAKGVEHYIVKPARRASLAARVRAALGEAAPSAGAALGAADDDDRAPPSTLAGARILLAEDNPVNALLARTLLARAGCVVDVVGDGEEAVAAVARAPYDLVFLDLRMPRLDGLAAARRIRALDGPAAQTPLVALTAEDGGAERAAVFAAGMNDFVTKPFDPLRLAAVAARFTGEAKAATV
ncbi:MAG: ATP-binding protein [Hyphomonadaceae bacterium]